MQSGQQVRLINDPGRIGIATEKSLERGNRTLILVRFPTGSEYIYLDQLEPIETSEHPLDLFNEKKLSGVKDLRRTLTFERLTGRLIDLIYSMEITNTDFYAYQFKPVLKIMENISKGILIADEVGLGKTIEAGLIWTELMSRYDNFRKLMILCPAVLREKWQLELKNRFGIKADIVTSKDAVKVLQNARAEGAYASFAIICSMQGLRPRRQEDEEISNDPLLKLIDECQYEEPLIDCLIIDEAHYLRNPETRTARLGKKLRSVSEFMILLSATPIHLRNADLFYLLNLIDSDNFTYLNSFNDVLDANKPLLKLKDLLMSNRNIPQQDFITLVEAAKSHRLLRDSLQLSEYIDHPPSDTELADRSKRAELASHFDSINILGNIVNRTRKRDVMERVPRKPHPVRIPLSAPEKCFYDKVTEIVREFCSKNLYYENFMLVTPQRQMSSSMPAALREWKRRGELLEDVTLYEDLGVEQENTIGPLTFELVSKAGQLGNYDELFANDSKYTQLEQVLIDFFEGSSSEKIVIFSFFKATLHYLHERLNSAGIGCIILEGRPDLDKTAIVDQFEKDEKIRVLLSSEVGSEGIDLQFCSTIINYDLPWNPMKVEQRIGRIDRIGQKAALLNIINLFYDETIDSRIYDRLLSRLKIFEEALGDIEAVIGDNIRRLSIDLLSNHLTPEEEDERIERTYQALANTKYEEDRLENEAASLVAYGDYILNKINAARDMNKWISGMELLNYVADYITYNYTGSEIKLVSPQDLICTITLSDQARQDFHAFVRQNKIATPTRLTSPNQTTIKCQFINKLFAADQKMEIINQIHPLVRFINTEIPAKEHYFHPAVSVLVDSEDLPNPLKSGIYAFAIQKWSFKGIRDIEKLVFIAVDIGSNNKALKPDDSENLIMSAALHGKNWHEARTLENWAEYSHVLNENCLLDLDTQFQEEYRKIRIKNEDQANQHIRTLEIHHENEKSRLLELIERHRSAGRDFQVRMHVPRLKKVDDQFEQQKKIIEKKRGIESNSVTINVGIIKVD